MFQVRRLEDKDIPSLEKRVNELTETNEVLTAEIAEVSRLSRHIYNSTIPFNFSGFLRKLENLENESGHGKVMKHEKLARSHGFFYQSWNYTKFAPELNQICTFFVITKK